MSTTVNSATTAANSSTSAAVTAAAQNTAATTLDTTQFLQLMTTQLKNQDPTQPLDPSQFVSQLAQLSEVSSIEGMQTSIASLVSSLSASQLLTGSTLVGRDVTATGNTVNLGATGTPSSGLVTVPAGTTALQVDVLDSTGQTVAQMNLTPQAGTQQAFSWDGNTIAGSRAPAGTYTIQAIGTVGGQSSSLTTEISTPVQSVSVNSSTNTLMLNTVDLGSVPFTSVTQVN
jgi:flagellar basal-body rod modification protein FlgD